MALTADEARIFLLAIAPLMEANQERLDQLDAVAGDGDHGATMVMGWTRVTAAVGDADLPLGPLFREAGAAFADVGGSIGPLWGTALLRAAREAGDAESVGLTTVAGAVTAATAGIAERGRSREGDKTLLDVLAPAARAFTAAVGAGESARAAATAGHDAAREGLLRTAGLAALRGRARRLSERSQGHQDPGAASAYLIWRQATEMVTGESAGPDPIVTGR